MFWRVHAHGTSSITNTLLAVMLLACKVAIIVPVIKGPDKVVVL